MVARYIGIRGVTRGAMPPQNYILYIRYTWNCIRIIEYACSGNKRHNRYTIEYKYTIKIGRYLYIKYKCRKS
jgi:hypothetical protein